MFNLFSPSLTHGSLWSKGRELRLAVGQPFQADEDLRKSGWKA